MKSVKKVALALVGVVAFTSNSNAQYYEMANQVVDMLTPALSGSFKYKGFVDAGYMKGVGDYNVDVLEITTTQGFQYASWFYMGVGAGVNILFAHTDDYSYSGYPGGYYGTHSTTTTGVMIPLYSDFRFNIGTQDKTSFFIDLRLGATFLVSDDYLAVDGGYISNKECFYFKPSLGVRIPTNKNNSKQAVNISLSYNLIDSEYDSWGGYYDDSATLHGIGATIGFEW